jgi:hypothetical protein
LQTLRHSPAPADKSRKACAKTPLTRPSLQTAPRPADARVAAVAPQGDCSRSTGDACADTRANNRDGVEPTRAAPAPGSRGSRHRSAAWPVASVAVAHVDTSMHCSTSDPGLANAAGTPRRRPHTAATPSPPSPPNENLSEARSAPHAYKLDSKQSRPPHRGAHVLITLASSGAGRKSNHSTQAACGGSIPVSTPGSIPVSVKARRPTEFRTLQIG